MNRDQNKNRIRLILVLSLICISLFGCRSSHEDKAQEVPADTSKPDITQGEKPDPEIKYHSSIQADKKLVWVCDYSFLVNVDDELFDEFNRLLVDEYKCDFTVDFIGINSRDYMNYQAELRNKKENGEQVDILYTGLGVENKEDTYTQAIKDALILPLTDLLQNTEYGKELYQAYDEKFWESMEYNGIIYGLRPLAELALRNGIIANNKYYHGEAITGQVTFDELGDILKKAYESSDGLLNTVLPLYVNSNALCSLEGYVQVSWGQDGIYYKRTNGSWQVVNGANEDRIQELWRKIREYNTLNNYEGGDPFEKLRGGQFYATICPYTLEGLNDGMMDLYDSLYEVTELNAVEGYIIYPQNAVTGIASWSEYPEEAMRLISLIETKAELSNLLAYGIEGKHYVIENNKLKKLSFNGRLPRESLANRMITFCEGLEPVNKTDVYKERNAEAILSPQVMYQLDYGDYEDQILEISKIYAEYSGLWNGEYKDVDGTISELRDRLKDAGIDELIKKLNKLLPE